VGGDREKFVFASLYNLPFGDILHQNYRPDIFLKVHRDDWRQKDAQKFRAEGKLFDMYGFLILVAAFVFMRQIIILPQLVVNF